MFSDDVSSSCDRWLVENQKVDYVQTSKLFSFSLTKHCVLELDRATPIHLCAFLGKEDIIDYLLTLRPGK